MRIIVTAATAMEWMPCFANIDKLYIEESRRFKVQFHQSGVGMLATTFSLCKLLSEEKPELVIQVGLAGCFDSKINLGEVMVVDKDLVGDMGVEEEGNWLDVFDMNLEKASYPPFKKKMLPNPNADKFNLLEMKMVKGITVNEITTKKDRITQLVKKYNPCIESMEGAALHYVCTSYNVPFIQMRAVCNYIGVRDKSKWLIKESLTNLNNTLTSYIAKLYNIK